jgi:hypothetical protein
MDFPAIVDVGIGMIIIYIAGALLVSGMQEILASVLQWRSQHLKESILQVMLGKDVSDKDVQNAKNLRDKIYKSPLIQSTTSTSISLPSKILSFSLLLGRQSLSNNSKPLKLESNSELETNNDTKTDINNESLKPESNSESETNNDTNQDIQKIEEKNPYKTLFLTSFPSYIDKEHFASSLVRELCKDKLKNFLEKEHSDVNLTGILGLNTIRSEINKYTELPQPFKDSMLALVDRAAFKIEAHENAALVFQKEIENWFDAAMDRASGVYKRNGQLVAGILGLAIAIFFNLDSFNISQKLMTDSTLRTLLADSASSLVVNSKADPNDPNSQLDNQKLQDNIAIFVGNSLPIVPIYENAANFLDCETQDACTLWPPFSQTKSFNLKRFFQALIGWMATTLAIHMGAPFWFDLLGKVVNVRSTGSKPDAQD